MTWRDQPAEQQTPAWVKGWLTARFRHHDMRLWPEQELGYEHDWPDALSEHGLMPPKDRERYEHEGRDLPATALAGLMSGVATVTEPDVEEDPPQP